MAKSASAGKMKKGNAPNPGQGKVHDAGFSYANYAKSNPKVGGQGKK